ncbi:MAG: TIGR00730 family Rossman fold protein [Microscillaceae bacterium]|jgi:hypothetical protein|nr:TIGR00730 family Rossman fold protein [Microscillaceae bacterium]
MLKNLAVFCGSSLGTDIEYKNEAVALGKLLATNQIRLIYGGGRVGLMGAIADSVLANGGEVVGVIPQFLWEREVGHSGLTDLHIVQSMHERKQKMAEFAEGFITMPGGIGSFEEFFEILTWRQLNLHQKPIGLLNVSGYYDLLIQFLENSVAKGFFSPNTQDLIWIENKPEVLLQKMLATSPAQDFDAGKI